MARPPGVPARCAVVRSLAGFFVRARSFGGAGRFGGCGVLVRVDLFEQGDGLADLLQVGGASAAGVQVSVDAGSPAARQVSVEVVTDEADKVAAGKVV